jgi:hypothetical protein
MGDPFQKSRAPALSACAFLDFQIRQGQIVWTDKTGTRFKERIQAITVAAAASRLIAC